MLQRAWEVVTLGMCCTITPWCVSFSLARKFNEYVKFPQKLNLKLKNKLINLHDVVKNDYLFQTKSISGDDATQSSERADKYRPERENISPNPKSDLKQN